MDIASFITSLNPWLLFVLVVAFCVLWAEAGALVAHKLARKGIKDPDTPVGTAVGALLGLLAFMLAFTFSITSSRFAERKELAVTHANAITTSYLRTSLLPEKQKQAIRKYYHEYTDILLGKNYPDEEMETAVQALEKLHILIWQQTATLPQEDIDSELRSLFVASVNEVVVAAKERRTVAMVFRIPSVVWSSLFMLAALGMFSIGFQTGTFGKRRIFDLPVLAAAFALVIILIATMDSSGRHRFKVNPQPFLDLEQLMKQDIP